VTEPIVDGSTDAPIFATDSGRPKPPPEVYGHTASALYRVDPIAHTVAIVGNFQGCSYINDIALDQNGILYGATGTALYSISTQSARCTLIANGTFPNSLSFVPVGTLDGANEALVGYEGGDYVRIDTNTGNKTVVGSLGGGYVSSGDVVSAIGGSTYVTVKGNGCSDCLVEVDPKTGALLKNWGDVGHTDVFGVAFWGGKVYGFANDGSLFEMSLANDSVTSTTLQSPANAWAGAGSTTSAPLIPPN
jgi:hypothetical protein